MEETKNSIKILKSKGLKIESLSNTYLNVSQTSIWSNDKFFIPIRKNSKRVKNKNLKRIGEYKFGLTEIKLNQLEKFKNNIKKTKF